MPMIAGAEDADEDADGDAAHPAAFPVGRRPEDSVCTWPL
jgi:hypothetical protein